MNYLQQRMSHLIRFNFFHGVIDRLSLLIVDLPRYTFFSVLSNYYTKRYLFFLMSLQKNSTNIFCCVGWRDIRGYKISKQFLNLHIFLYFFWSYSHKTIQNIYKFNLIIRIVSTFIFCLMIVVGWVAIYFVVVELYGKRTLKIPSYCIKYRLIYLYAVYLFDLHQYYHIILHEPSAGSVLSFSYLNPCIGFPHEPQMFNIWMTFWPFFSHTPGQKSLVWGPAIQYLPKFRPFTHK